jgi:hypothetical protein
MDCRPHFVDSGAPGRGCAYGLPCELDGILYIVDWISLFFEYLIQIDFSACNDIFLVHDLLH